MPINCASMQDFNSERMRPFDYFMSQVKDLFKKAAPNMTSEQLINLSTLEQSISSASTYTTEVINEQIKEVLVQAENKQNIKKEELYAISCEYQIIHPQEKASKAKSDAAEQQLIMLKMEKKRLEGHLEDQTDKSVQMFAERMKKEYELGFDLLKLKQKNMLEKEKLQLELDLLHLQAVVQPKTRIVDIEQK